MMIMVLRIAGEMVLQPQRSFEIEIVGRFVEQQQVRLGKQSGGKRDAHAPAAGEFGAWTLLICRGKTQARKNRGRARRRCIRADVGKPGLDLGDSVRIVRGLRFGEKPGALEIGCEHHIEQAIRAAGRFLRQTADAPARRHLDLSMLGRNIAGDHAKQCGLAGPVASDQADAGAGRNADAGGF